MSVPCFCHTQASGKKRRIDNAKKATQNRLTQRAEQFTMNNALIPAVAVRLVFALAETEVYSKGLDSTDFNSGGEDMPDAFRGMPTMKEHLIHNIVAANNPKTGELMFFQVYAALFGYEASVYAFGRLSALLQAAGRRMAMLLWSMYVDDGKLVDNETAKWSGQVLVGKLFNLLGTRFKKEKRVWMSKQNDFLGIIHDFSEIAKKKIISFWPRDSLCTKIQESLESFEKTRLCYPGDASKFRGMQSFCGLGIFGQLGKAAVAPFTQRQYFDLPC